MSNLYTDTIKAATPGRQFVKVEYELRASKFSDINGQPLQSKDFKDLLDAPGSYLGNRNKVLKVKDTEDGLEFQEQLYLDIEDTKTSTFSVEVNRVYGIDTTLESFSAQLPVNTGPFTLSKGDTVTFIDVTGSCSTNPFTVLGPSGTGFSYDIATGYTSVKFVYTGLRWAFLAAVTNMVAATESDAREGIESSRFMTPLRTRQAIESFTLYNTNIKTSYYLSEPYDRVLIDSSSATSSPAFHIDLPASPQDNTQVGVLDVGFSAQTHNVIIDGNGSLIENDPNFTIDVSGSKITFLYVANTGRWYIYTN